MKRLLIFAVALMTLSGTMLAQSQSTTSSAEKEIPLIHKTLRPKDTSYAEDNVSCYYGNGMLTFEFADAEGKATLSVTRIEDGAKSVTSFFTWSAYTYAIGSVPGTYLLDLTTSRNSYQGFLIIE